MERQPTPKERWARRKRQLGARSIWDDIRAKQILTFRDMSPDELAQQFGQYEILSAQQVCAEQLAAARNSGDNAAVEQWRVVEAYLDERRKEYYRRSQGPSRFSSSEAQAYASRPPFNPRSPF